MAIASVTSASTAPHYNWGDGCDGWRLTDTPALSVIEERMPAGTSETRHFHAVAAQVFFVLEGSLTIELEGEVHKMTASEALNVPAKAVHRVFNDSAQDVRFLVVSSPETKEDRHAA